MIRLVTLNPGHFHAALIQKEMPPGVDPRVTVYAPPGPDLDAHLARINGFNTRAENPTGWELDVRASEDWLERFQREPVGDVAVIAGRNRGKLDLMRTAVEAGLHVLADKPWIIEAEDFPKLESLVELAEQRQRIIFDVMTERHEITAILQRALMDDPAVFGNLQHGSIDEPALSMDSVHYLKKLVAGQPLRRPVWFFNTAEQGEALPDVGTHLVDLALWLMLPETPIDHRRDVEIVRGERWPVRMTSAEFQAVTGSPAPSDPFDYWCNNRVHFRVRGYHVRLNVVWDYASPGTDLHHAIARGTKSNVVIQQIPVAGSHPELSVEPHAQTDRMAFRHALQHCLKPWPSVTIEEREGTYHIHVPDALRIGHEAHFAAVVRHFLGHVSGTVPLTAWEMPNLLTKYRVTTGGVAIARQG